MTTSISSLRLVAMFFVLVAGPAFLRAEDRAAPETGKSGNGSAAKPDEIQNWIRDLDSNSFNERQAAARKLGECGKDATEALAKAARGESVEVTRQAIDILRRQYQSNDPATSQAAAAALKTLAESDNKSAASRAAEILKQAGNPQNQPNGSVPGVQPAIPPLPLGGIGGIQVVPLPLGGVVQRIHVQAQNNNGAKVIEVEENGKKVKINEDQNGIKITTSENVNGQEKSETTEAKDLDELKKKNPEAAKAYEKYAAKGGAGNVIIGGGANGGAIQIQINGQAVPVPVPRQNVLPGNVLPAIPLVPALPIAPGVKGRPNPNTNRKQARELLDDAKKQLEKALEQVKTNPDGALDAIQSAKTAVEEAQSKLNGVVFPPRTGPVRGLDVEIPGGEEGAKRLGEGLKKSLEDAAKALEGAK